jgi:hypothetical protein
MQFLREKRRRNKLEKRLQGNGKDTTCSSWLPFPNLFGERRPLRRVHLLVLKEAAVAFWRKLPALQGLMASSEVRRGGGGMADQRQPSCLLSSRVPRGSCFCRQDCNRNEADESSWGLIALSTTIVRPSEGMLRRDWRGSRFIVLVVSWWFPESGRCFCLDFHQKSTQEMRDEEVGRVLRNKIKSCWMRTLFYSHWYRTVLVKWYCTVLRSTEYHCIGIPRYLVRDTNGDWRFDDQKTGTKSSLFLVLVL